MLRITIKCLIENLVTIQDSHKNRSSMSREMTGLLESRSVDMFYTKS